MRKDLINCPKCNYEIEIAGIISKEIEARLKEEYNLKLKIKEEEILAEKKNIEKEFSLRLLKEKEKIFNKIKIENEIEIKDLKNQLEENSRKLSEANSKELEFRKQQRELQEKIRNADIELEKK